MTEKLDQWVLMHYGQEVFHPGLERISRALLPLKQKLQTLKIVTVAGTNGKGETSLRLAHLLKNSQTFCLWTSPHVEHLRERFSSHEGDIDEEELKNLLLECHEKAGQENYQLTFYEFLFFAFCSWVVKKKPQVLILEVGLGGRLDAVNALDAEMVLLTSISRDHQEFLGNRYDAILAEKLGVLKRGATLISYLDLDYLRERAERIAFKKGSEHLDLEKFKKHKSYEFSFRNQFLATAAFSLLNKLPFDPHSWVADSSQLPHRGEIVNERHEWHFFGSHNVDGMRKLIQFLTSRHYNFRDPSFDVILTSFSKRDEKDVMSMLRMLKNSGLGRVVVTTFSHPKAFESQKLENLTRQEGLEFAPDIAKEVHGWNHQKILVAGSYYFLSELKSLFRH